MARTTLKAKRIVVSGSNPIQAVANINWLLDHGARVTVVGAPDPVEMEKRVHDHLKRTARDGDEYESARVRLSWRLKSTEPFTDLQNIFLTTWKRSVVGITGEHGKTMTAVWAAHLIGDAVVAGHTPERPLLPALDSRARVAVIKLRRGVPVPSKVKVVNTDGLSNLDAAVQTARLVGVAEPLIQKRVSTLPQVPLRQEVVHQSAGLTIVNDALATKPPRGVAALRTWGGPTCVLICGGTDANFDYSQWAHELQARVRPTNTIFLTGSATRKMRTALGEFSRGIRAFDSLEAAYKAARVRAGLYVSSVILFSPAAQSGEQFTDEYDRGQRFSSFIKEEFR